MEQLNSIVSAIDGWVWGIPLIVLLFGTHLFLTFRLGIQRYIFKAIKISVTKDDYKSTGDVSQFGALATALAATIGTGNIVGVATAVALGGPGAVLWTWLTGVFGIATKYGEAVLSVKYRVQKPDGEMAGGPMYVCEHGLGQKWLGVLFAFFAGVAAFGIGNMVQANSISVMVKETFNVSPIITGIIMAALTAVVILGGVQSITKVTEKLVPFMAGGYVSGMYHTHRSWMGNSTCNNSSYSHFSIHRTRCSRRFRRSYNDDGNEIRYSKRTFLKRIRSW